MMNDPSDVHRKRISQLNNYALTLASVCLALKLTLILASGTAGMAGAGVVTLLTACFMKPEIDAKEERWAKWVSFFVVALSVVYVFLFLTIIIHRSSVVISPLTITLHLIATAFWFSGIYILWAILSQMSLQRAVASL